MLRLQLTDLPQFRRDLMVGRWGTLTVGDLYAVSQKASETVHFPLHHGGWRGWRALHRT